MYTGQAALLALPPQGPQLRPHLQVGQGEDRRVQRRRHQGRHADLGSHRQGGDRGRGARQPPPQDRKGLRQRRGEALPELRPRHTQGLHHEAGLHLRFQRAQPAPRGGPEDSGHPAGGLRQCHRTDQEVQGRHPPAHQGPLARGLARVLHSERALQGRGTERAG